MLRARDEQLELAGELLHRARHGRGGSLAVVAEPGLGRTALLESVVRDASADFHVVGVRGIRAETELVGAALHRVLGNRETNPYAVHRLLVESARRRPLLCWADDAHWLDRASLAALAFVARRVRDEPLVMMFSAADEPPEALAGIRTLRLPRLDRPASLEVLADHAADGMPPDLAAELCEVAAGNPLALVELYSALTPAQLSGDEPAPAAPPADGRFRRHCRRRFRRLPYGVRALVMLVVVDGRLDTEVLARAAALSGLDLSGLEQARASGLIKMEGTVLGICPLDRACLYADAPLAERQAAHRLLTRVLDDPLRSVWHRVAVAEVSVHRLARELREAAELSRRLGEFADSARAWQQAAVLTAEPAGRAALELEAAGDFWIAGRVREARALLLRPDAGGEAELLRGMIELQDGVPARARQILMGAADRLDPVRAVGALALAGEAGCRAGELTWYGTAASRARELPGELLQDYLEGMAASIVGAEAAVPLSRAVRQAEQSDDCAAKIWGSLAALVLGDDARTHALAIQAVDRAYGRHTVLRPWALEFLALAELWRGRYPAAVACSLDGLRRARAAGQGNVAADHLALLAVLAAFQGDRETAMLRIEAASDPALVRGLAWPGTLTSWAIACLDLLADRPADATARLRLMTGPWQVHPLVKVMATPHLVEAAVRSGQSELAVPAAEIFVQWAMTTGSSTRLALAARIRALLTEGREADGHFQEALRLHRCDGSAFELARTELLYGHWLRRERKPKAARGHLRVALQLFQHYDAEQWAARARAELRAAGETVEQPEPGGSQELTPQQLEIARLAADGATNREIAARLVLSPRTIDHHLRNVFVRLGIRSRVELARLLP